MTMLRSPEIDIQHLFHPVRSESTPGLFASEGPLFFGAVFGRDSLEASEHIVGFEPYIPRYNTLQVLASLQGLEYNPISEEEPGRIHHEYRHIRNVRDEEGLRIFETLSKNWGGNDTEMTYYGTVDATPLFIRLSIEYIKQYGEELLFDPIKGRDGNVRPFSDHLQMALDWQMRRIEQSKSGMVEYKRSNPLGLLNPVWEDSETSYLHIDGSAPNYEGPIVPVEVQGYAYDALKGMAELFPGSVPGDMIEKFGRRILDNFWLPDQQMFAKGLDYDEGGNLRPIRTPDSNGALLLDSQLLLDFPEGKEMAEAPVRAMMGPDFLTDAGIRCRSLAYADIVDYPDYHGGYAVWAKQTANIMKGMLNHGYYQESIALAQRIVDNIARHDGEYFELNYVDADGTVIHPQNQTGIFADIRANTPEPGQTWSKSAFLLSVSLLTTREQLGFAA